jgi:thymidylate synthase
MLKRDRRRLPDVHLTEAGKRVRDIHDFRSEHFELANYIRHPAISGIPASP